MLERLKSGLKRYPVMITWMVVILFLLISAVLGGYFGQVGADSDDQMRLVQIRDLMAGQAWFDPLQYRLGLDGGTIMHWSRLVDLPILVLIKTFDVFLPYHQAEGLAVTLWPPLTTGLVLAGLALGARGIEHRREARDKGGSKILLFTLIISGAYLSQHFRFMPGAIDHHNLQLGALALAMGGVSWTPDRARYYALAGAACTVSLAIGMEANIFIATLCVYVAGLWAVSGITAKRGAQAFGLALALSSVFVLCATVSPHAYFKMTCDAFSGLVVLAALLGGLGLVGLSRIASERSRLQRVMGLAVIGFICAAVLLMAAPQCLSNPLNALSPQMKTYWLDQITEARPLIQAAHTDGGKIFFFLCVPILAFGLCVKNLLTKQALPQTILCLVLLVSAFAMTIYQVRFYIFLHIFALLPVAIWVAHVFVTGKEKNPGSVTYLFALIAASPMVYLLLGSYWAPSNKLIVPDVNSSANSVPSATLKPPSLSAQAPHDLETCYSPKVLEVYSAHKGARILAASNAAPLILLSTDDEVVFGNYHRNMQGIAAALDIFMSDKSLTQSLLTKYKIDYLHFCEQDGAITNFKTFAPQGLIAQIINDSVPQYLELMPLKQAGTGARVYKVVPLSR